jgi:hypothetical protein
MNGSHPQDETSAFDASELANRIRQGDLPVVKAPDPLAPGDQCHFSSPVRFGRRRADQFGHLLLTSGWLKFRGTLDLSVTWSEIADVRRVVREIVVSLQDSRRLLRFSCHSASEAARGALIAQQLAQSARVHTAESGAYEHHAAL